jgi:heavy metal sensor kinase
MKPPVRFRVHSVRARLALWNVLVMAALLIAMGAALRYVAAARLNGAVDSQLLEQAARMSSMWRGRGVGGPPFGGRRRGDGPHRQPWGNGTRPPPDERHGPPREAATPEEARIQRALRLGSAADQPAAAGPTALAPLLVSREGLEFRPGKSNPLWDRTAFTRALEGQTGFSTVEVEGEPVRVYTAPVGRQGSIDAVVQVAATLTETRQEANRITTNLLTVLPVALLGVAASGLFLTGRALRPVRDITRAAGQIGVRNLSERLPLRGGDEFESLAATFNGMLARLEEAFERQRRFTADASHELRTPLTVIKTSTSLALSSDRAPDEYRRTLAGVDRAADMMTRIVEDLLFLARAEAPTQVASERSPVLADDVLETAVGTVRAPGRATLLLETEDSSLSVWGDRHELVRLFLNLLNNAVRHTPPDGRVRVSARATDDGQAVLIEVADTGEGIAPEHLPRIFEPFYRADTSRTRSNGDRDRASGTGLGLAICKAIVEAHGGEISLDSAPGQGTTVRVRLPRPPA